MSKEIVHGSRGCLYRRRKETIPKKSDQLCREKTRDLERKGLCIGIKTTLPC